MAYQTHLLTRAVAGQPLAGKFIDPRTNCVLIESSPARIDSSRMVNWDPVTGGSVVLYLMIK